MIIIYVGSVIADEMNKQLPKELKINQKKIFLEAFFYSLIIGGTTYLVLNIIW